jgi:hypothetical protein
MRVQRGRGAYSSVESTSLSWLVELELVVTRNVSRSSMAVEQDSIGQGHCKGVVGCACDKLHHAGRCRRRGGAAGGAGFGMGDLGNRRDLLFEGQSRIMVVMPV